MGVARGGDVMWGDVQYWRVVYNERRSNHYRTGGEEIFIIILDSILLQKLAEDGRSEG